MPGLINSKLRAVRQAERGQKPPALIRDVTCHFDSLAPQLGQGGLNVVTHEVELVMACTVSWVNRKLGRGQSENEPASARVSRWHAQYVCEECAHLRGIRGKHDGMYSRDHIAILTVDPAVAVICPRSGAGELLEWHCWPSSSASLSGRPPVVFPGPALAARRCRKADTSGVGLVTDIRSEARHPGPIESCREPGRRDDRRGKQGARDGDVAHRRGSGLVILAAAFVMMACAAPSLASPRPHGSWQNPVGQRVHLLVDHPELVRESGRPGGTGPPRRRAGRAQRVTGRRHDCDRHQG